MALTSCIFALILAARVASAEFSGSLSADGLSYFDPQPVPVEQSEGRLEGDLNFKYFLSQHLVLRIHPYFLTSTTPQAWENPLYVDPRDLSLGVEGHWAHLRAGYFTLHFEGTDGLNPMDIASQHNYGDPLRDITKASAGLQLGGMYQALEWEVEWIPSQTQSSLPGEGSPWWPRKYDAPLRSGTNQALLPQIVYYQIQGRQQINSPLLNNWAGRLQYHGNWAEIALAGYSGAASAPLLEISLNATPLQIGSTSIYQLNSPVMITPVDYQTQTVAGYISKPWGSWIFKLAGRYDQPVGNDPRLPAYSQQSIGGFEKNFQIYRNNITCVVQYALTQKPDDGSLVSLNDLYDRTLLLAIRIPVGERWTFLTSGFRSFKDGSTLLLLDLQRRFEPAWTADLTVQDLTGPSGSLLGALDYGARGDLKITRSF